MSRPLNARQVKHLKKLRRHHIRYVRRYRRASSEALERHGDTRIADTYAGLAQTHTDWIIWIDKELTA